jgi:hypothetical protein
MVSHLKLYEIIQNKKMINKVFGLRFNVINMLILILATATLNYSTLFWLGSQEEYLLLKKHSFLLLILNRQILNTIVILFYLISITIMVLIFRRKSRKVSLKKILLFDFFILSIVSLILILVRNY